jgi:uncharacterized protein (UPF0276 family)
LSSPSVGLQAGTALVPLLACGLVDEIDHVEIIPDRCWFDRGMGRGDRFVDDPASVQVVDELARMLPVWAHGVGLSIASARFDDGHARQLAAWHRRVGFAEVSEHLAAFRLFDVDLLDHHAGVGLALPWDWELLDLLVPRLHMLHELLGRRLLLENGVMHTRVPWCELTEGDFMTELVAASGCEMLLDVHNLVVNCRAHGDDPIATAASFPLAAVAEIHIAGGRSVAGTYLDAHSGACPDDAWAVLDSVAPRCPNLRGVTFEIHESYVASIGADGIASQLRHARTVLEEAGCRTPATSAR